ncbi:hypothetical protein M0805_005832 [Coniferiporia weirii]|nr:hypothetical protein M0805_005832 [Coniferiporia weirii]
MSSRPKHVRRLSLFGLGSSQPLSPDELTPRQNANASFSFPLPPGNKQVDGKGASRKAQPKPGAPLTRKLSKKRPIKPLPPPPSSSPPPVSKSISSKSFSSLTSAQLADHGHEPEKLSGASLRKKPSLNLRLALTTIFVPKPSRTKVAGILRGVEGISGGRTNNVRNGGDERSYTYTSRSPSPPSPEIRPPSGLGQIASSIDLSTYAQEEREGSLLASLSRSESRAPSIMVSVSFLPSSNASTNASLINEPLKWAGSESCESIGELLSRITQQEPTAPSQKLIDVLQLTTKYCLPGSLFCLSHTCRAFLGAARDSLYANIDSDDLQEKENRKRRMLETLVSNPEVASRVRSFRWVCSNTSSSPLLSSVSSKHSIPRRAPNISISSSPEEYILPRVLSLLPNVNTLILVQPPPSLLVALLPARQSQRSPCPSPQSIPSQLQSLLPPLSSLSSLTLSGRTTLSTAFGAILVRFLELHPGITELNLPDVFCLPIPTSSRPGSSSPSPSHSPHSSPIDGVPPVPPLPSYFLTVKEKEPLLEILPKLTRLTAPLTLATQLIPGRPLRAVDIELTTSLYEGLRPIEIAQSLADAGIKTTRNKQADVNWRAARQARRAGFGKGTTLRELRIRCTAKVDGRTIGRVLNAVGTEVGASLEVLAIGWSGPENGLHEQLTLSLVRFQALQRLELFSTSGNSDDEDEDDPWGSNRRSVGMGAHVFPRQASLADLQAGIALEQRLVEQWALACPLLTYMEFASARVWKAR